MSSEFLGHGLEGTETQEEIKQADTSTTQSQASTSHDEVLLDIRDQKLLDDLGRLQEGLPATERQRVWPNGKNRVEIKRIPDIMMRNGNFRMYFWPKNWRIGPINGPYPYHDKLKLAALFISETGSAREVILKDFKGKMNGVRACFDKDIISDIEDEELMRILFMDGCSILGFILGHMNHRLNEVGISDAEAANIVQDLLLLDNQIPFQVLEVLIGSGTDQIKENLKGSLVKFIYLICRGTLPGCSAVDLFECLEKYCFSPEINKNQKAVHLLDVFREALLFNPPSFNLFGLLLTVFRRAFWILCSCGCLANSYFLERFKPKPHYNIISLFRTAKEFFFSVQELKAAGIKFKPSHSLKTVSFRYLFFIRAQLMLPTLIVDDSMASKLLNLVTYEMCLSESHPNEKPWVASYVNLLYLLINNEQDVKDLIEADLLRNFLNSDKAVADMIKLIGSVGFTPPIDAYEGVKLKLEKHYEKKWRRKCAIWMEQVYVYHFNNPWTILALLATTTALLLTAIQTWYAMNPKK